MEKANYVNENDTWGIAGYGQICLHGLLPGLSLTAGLRYDYEKTNLDYRDSVLFTGGNGFQEFHASEENTDFQAWLPKFSALYQCNDHLSIYATIAKGYKAGGYNIIVNDMMSKEVNLRYDAEKLWNAVFEAGKEFGILPIGLGARDTLRLEAGFCLYGHEIDDDHSPIEAGLGWITKFVPGNDFIMREYHEKLKADKPSRYLKPFELVDRGIARQGYPIEDAEGNEIGVVCSGTMSPLTGKSIGTGYVKAGFQKLDTEIFIRVRNKALKAKIVKAPFFNAEEC